MENRARNNEDIVGVMPLVCVVRWRTITSATGRLVINIYD